MVALIWMIASVAMGAPHEMTDAACSHCHTSPHEEQVSERGDCGTCHTSDDWAPSLLTASDHDAFRFPLTGLHIEVACGSCHSKGKLVGLPVVCNECHVDRHRGKLGQTCEDCHSTSGFKPVAGFDHAEKTGFALTGTHAGKACADCHEGDNGSAMRTRMDVGCDTCHTPVHGEFAKACSDCHSPVPETTNFLATRLTFKHRTTGFNLERRHRKLGCVECHETGKKSPNATCSTCHTDPHAGQLTGACEDCHKPDRWNLVRFDHDATGWVLRGKHFLASCDSCHTSNQWLGLHSNCAGCHARDALKGPAAITAHISGVGSCQDCHRSQFQWTFNR